MRIALASPQVARSVSDGLERVEQLMAEAASQKAAIVCFPEAYLPGLRGQDFEVPDFGHADEQQVLAATSNWSRKYQIATILSLELVSGGQRQIAAAVWNRQGESLGQQTKNQLAPSEDAFYWPGKQRRMFEIDGMRFGISICHEGWRYPETVRWAAVRGAQIVFHPQHTGGLKSGRLLTRWGSQEAPYFEQAMSLRSRENGIYFASVNYALPYQVSATSLIRPDGTCQAFLPYGQEGILVVDLELDTATGIYAKRYAPERYNEMI